MSDLNRISSRITQPPSQGASQAMLYATGLTRDDMDKAQVGIAACWYEGNPCNMHLDDLGRQRGNRTDEQPERHEQGPHPGAASRAPESGSLTRSESME